jgi:hypothetical protein
MSKLELTSLNCTNCGASLSGYEGKDELQCDYCNTNNRILRPRSITVTKDNLSSENYDKLNNFVEILQKAIRAGNYNEGYDYCNKALEINPNIGAIWENKAICAFWRSVSYLNEDKIVLSNAREIRTFLSASRENDPGSETYDLTADAIGSNLATILKLKIALTAPDSATKVGKKDVQTYSVRAFSRIKDYLETLETAFEIMENKDLDILKYLVNEFSNLGKIKWWEAIVITGSDSPSNIKLTLVGTSSGIDVGRKLEILIKKIQIIDPGYSPPKINLGLIKPAPWYVIVIIFVVVAIVTYLSVSQN